MSEIDLWPPSIKSNGRERGTCGGLRQKVCEGLDSHRLEVVDVLPLGVNQLGEQLSQPVLLLPSQRAVLPVTQGQPGQKVVDKLGHHPRPQTLSPKSTHIHCSQVKGRHTENSPPRRLVPNWAAIPARRRGTARPEKRGAGVHPLRNVAEEESKGTLWCRRADLWFPHSEEARGGIWRWQTDLWMRRTMEAGPMLGPT